jgi:hypothetical protein
MSSNAVAGKYVNVRIEGATDADVFAAADQMGVWTPPNVKVYDKRDNTGVFIYGRKYLAQTATVPAPAPQRVQPRTVSRQRPPVVHAPTGRGYIDDADEREWENATGRDGRPAF